MRQWHVALPAIVSDKLGARKNLVLHEHTGYLPCGDYDALAGRNALASARTRKGDANGQPRPASRVMESLQRKRQLSMRIKGAPC